jgi:hypothetical protein
MSQHDIDKSNASSTMSTSSRMTQENTTSNNDLQNFEDHKSPRLSSPQIKNYNQQDNKSRCIVFERRKQAEKSLNNMQNYNK